MELVCMVYIFPVLADNLVDSYQFRFQITNPVERKLFLRKIMRYNMLLIRSIGVFANREYPKLKPINVFPQRPSKQILEILNL